MFDFLFTSHDGLSVVVVSGECFLASDIMQVVNCKQWLIRKQHVVCHVSRPRHGKIYDPLIVKSDTVSILTDKNIL